MKHLVMIVERVPQYRVAFFNGLRIALAAAGVRLSLFYGQPSRRDSAKNDTVKVAWAKPVRSRTWSLGRRDLVWQPVLSCVRDADLVIVNQGVRFVANYPLMMMRASGLIRLAFWDHGPSLNQPDASVPAAWLKQRTAKCTDWWFTYTEGCASKLRALGFPASRITVFQNSIDTRELVRERARLSHESIDTLRVQLGIGEGPVCLYCGAMYREKRLGFLLDACVRVRSHLPSFQMLFLGDGPDREMILREAARRPWIKYVGPVFGTGKVPYFALSDLLLTPHGVGLVVLDAFALGVPLVTTDGTSHGPEIEYLEDGVNGVISPGHRDAAAYARTVVDLLRDTETRRRLARGCLAAAKIHTNEAMVQRFTDGVLAAIGGQRPERPRPVCASKERAPV